MGKTLFCWVLPIFSAMLGIEVDYCTSSFLQLQHVSMFDGVYPITPLPHNMVFWCFLFRPAPPPNAKHSAPVLKISMGYAQVTMGFNRSSVLRSGNPWEIILPKPNMPTMIPQCKPSCRFVSKIVYLIPIQSIYVHLTVDDQFPKNPSGQNLRMNPRFVSLHLSLVPSGKLT